MIDFAQLLPAGNIDCKVSVASKKKSLQRLSEILFNYVNQLDAGDEDQNTDEDTEQADANHEELYCEMDILDAFIGRERLGSTGLGSGISIPHGRLAGLQHPVACLVTLQEGVEFEAPDDQPVDVLLGLLVPQESTEEHLQILALMAQAFSDEQLCADIRAFSGEQSDELHQRLQQWSQDHIDKDSPLEDT